MSESLSKRVKVLENAVLAICQRLGISLGESSATINPGGEGKKNERQQSKAWPPLEAKARSGRVRDLVNAAYFEATGGASNKYVRLADLRARLAGVSREEVDTMLMKMQSEGKALLYPMDDPNRYVGKKNATELRRADAEASLLVSGERRDLFLIR